MQYLNNYTSFYSCFAVLSSAIEKKNRSRMNIPFRIGGPEGNDALEKKFLEVTKAQNMLNLKGHR